MANDSEKQLVILKIGKEEFGVDIFEVKEIIKHEEITPVPEAEDYVEGIINLRGSVITLIDLAKKLDLPSNPDNKDTRTMIIEAKDTYIGMRVDEVVRVSKFGADAIQPPPKTITEKIHDDFIEGVIVSDNNPIIVLDLAKIFEDEELHHLNEEGKKAEKQHEEKQEENQDAENKQTQTTKDASKNESEKITDTNTEDKKESEQQKPEDEISKNEPELTQEKETKKEEKPETPKQEKTEAPKTTKKKTPKRDNKKTTPKKNKTLKQSEDGCHFITLTGDELKNAKDLHDYVEKLSEDEFKSFVTEDKNDFYNWIKHAVKDDELAEKIQLIKTKDDLTQTLIEHIKDLI